MCTNVTKNIQTKIQNLLDRMTTDGFCSRFKQIGIMVISIEPLSGDQEWSWYSELQIQKHGLTDVRIHGVKVLLDSLGEICKILKDNL